MLKDTLTLLDDLLHLLSYNILLWTIYVNYRLLDNLKTMQVILLTGQVTIIKTQRHSSLKLLVFFC